MVRYADDFVILCASREEAEAALDTIRQWMEQAGLTLHPAKTRIVDATQKGGFDFPGYHFERGYRWPRQKSLDKFKDAIRQKTGKLRGGRLSEITDDLNRTMRGWFEYFKHSHGTTFRPLHSWLRGRPCERSCASGTKAKAVGAGETINAGPTPPSRNWG